MPIQVGDMKLYDVEELSEMLSIQPVTVRKYLREGKIRAKKLAKRWYVTEESLKEYFLEEAPDGLQERP